MYCTSPVREVLSLFQPAMLRTRIRTVCDCCPCCHRYSALHKLCVQQCPRSSVAGLMWALETAGFSSVALSTSLDTYFVGSNSFSGFTSIITCDL